MNIRIYHDKYIIRDDPYCYRLIELRSKNAKKEDVPDDEEIVETSDGEFNEVVIGYYSTLAHLIEDLMEREKRNNRCTTLDGFAKHLEKINKEAAEIINVLVKVTGSHESLRELIDTPIQSFPDELKEPVKPRGRKKGA